MNAIAAQPTAAQRVAARIMALPAAEQKRALLHFRTLVEERRAQLGPVAIDAATMASRLGLELDPWQVDVVTSASKRILLNCSRQSGKSTVTALLAVYTAHFEPESLVLLLSPSLRQSQELFKKSLDLHRRLDDAVPSEAESALRLELKNGSRIVSLPGTSSTIRGYSGVRLLAIDEAARVDSELYAAVRPMLAVSGGRLIALSTPFGTRGWWHDAWYADEPWERYEIPASQCPRISPAFLDEERRTLGEWWFKQEYECQFMDAESQPFGRADIERAFSESVEIWNL